MANCRGKRGNEGDRTGHLENCKRPRENEKLKCQLRTAEEGKSKCRPDNAKENDVQMLQEELQSCQLQLSDSALQKEELERNAVKAEQVRLELEARVAKMQQQLYKALDGCGSYADGAATPFLIETWLKAVQTAGAIFTKAFSEYAQMDTAEEHCALRKHFQNNYLTRPSHITYLLKAWTFETLFQDFENENFISGGASIFLDPMEQRLKSFEYFKLLESNASVFDDLSLRNYFENFCCRKLRAFLSLWQSSDQTTVANLSIDALESPGAEAKVRLLESFRQLAKRVWTLHKLSYSFQTRAEIFRVSQQADLHADYMESVVSRQDDELFISKVGFMICPGFRLNNSVFKCQIYLAAGASLA